MPNPYGWGQNEPQIKPKDQGGDTIATFSQKVYNLFNSLFATLNSYPWSAATHGDAGYMSAEDKTKLDSAPTLITSGTISGYALFNNILLEWGFCTARSSGQDVTFSRPYKETPRIFLTPQLNNTSSISAAQTAFCIDRSLTGFKAVSCPASSVDCGFFAIGIGE